MQIVSSEIILDNTQSDGRRVIIEQFIDDQGNVYQQSYMADVNTDIDKRLVNDAVQLAIQLNTVPDNN